MEPFKNLKLENAGGVYCLTFSPDGKRIVSGSYDNTVKVWDAQSGQLALTLQGHTRDVSSVAFSPDGQRLASGSFDKTVKVWDVQTGQEQLTLKGHTDSVYGMAFSPDGKTLISTDYYGNVLFWNLEQPTPEQDREKVLEWLDNNLSGAIPEDEIRRLLEKGE